MRSRSKEKVKTLPLDFDVKSTFEQPSEECSKGNPPWTADLGVMSRDATTLRSSFEQRLRWPRG
ncbi:hypothetical protein DVQ18_08625 [Yersinia enterocolitica]|nr:hypothetical protein [Yersinia enterocolitica]EKN5076554.1 hypothetical protein [Yersinia enterocolitica]EKN5136037.1 hypothetical protein [Yersinia enterocolitica]EKN5161499.1 hypothetical protein [Yersinia enterocolitica]EKN6072764.1 hypothetical protein [Yersinia enterocolitica]